MDGKITQSQLLLMILQLILKADCCPQTKPSEWIKILLYMHTRGWLYVAFEKEKLSVVVGAYRIKEFDPEKTGDDLPLDEEGNILYIPFMASFAEDKFLPKKILSNYLNKNPDIKEIVFFEGEDGDHIRKFRRKGVDDVKKTESPELASDAAVSGRPEIPCGT